MTQSACQSLLLGAGGSRHRRRAPRTGPLAPIPNLGYCTPVVAENEFVTHEIGLADISVSPAFRSLLRIYDLESSGNRQVRIGLYAHAPVGTTADQLLAEFVVPFAYDPLGSTFEPGYAELPLWNIPALTGQERVRATITADTPGLRFWGFGAITNNETQHVTVIAPQRVR